MASETTPAPRWIPILVALIIGVLIGHLARPRKQRVENLEVRTFTVDQSVTVGPPVAAVHPDPIYLHHGGTADWTLIDPSGNTDALRVLYIDVDSPDLFPKSTPVPNSNPPRYRLPCTGPYCSSGAVQPGAIIGHSYKYWQVAQGADGKPVIADGHIIIVKP
jgi:hypothetical protein